MQEKFGSVDKKTTAKIMFLREDNFS